MGVQQTDPGRTVAARGQRITNRAGILVILGVAALVAGYKGEASVQEQDVRPVKVEQS